MCKGCGKRFTPGPNGPFSYCSTECYRDPQRTTRSRNAAKPETATKPCPGAGAGGQLCGKTILATSDRCVDCQLAHRRQAFRKTIDRQKRRTDPDDSELLSRIAAAAPAPPLEADEPTSWHAEAAGKKSSPRVEDEFESIWDGRSSLIGDRSSIQR